MVTPLIASLCFTALSLALPNICTRLAYVSSCVRSRVFQFPTASLYQSLQTAFVATYYSIRGFFATPSLYLLALISLATIDGDERLLKRVALAWLFIACATYLTHGYISWKWTGRRAIQLLPLELLLPMGMRRALELSSAIEDGDLSSPTLLALILSLPMISNSICFSLMYARKLELLA